MAVTRAGTIPYFADRVGIDLLGKNDAHIAHEPMRRSSPGLRALVEFKPGHMKFDYAYSIEMQAPDLIMNLWQHPEEVMPYIHAHYVGVRLGRSCIYVRRDSPRILWSKLPDRDLSRTADFDSCFMGAPEHSRGLGHVGEML